MTVIAKLIKKALEPGERKWTQEESITPTAADMYAALCRHKESSYESISKAGQDFIQTGLDNLQRGAKDPGAHYRYSYKGVKLDPARIALVYGGMSGMPFTILKKVLRMGTGGKSKRQDLLDIISAAQRELELMDEDEVLPIPE